MKRHGRAIWWRAALTAALVGASFSGCGKKDGEQGAGPAAGKSASPEVGSGSPAPVAGGTQPMAQAQTMVGREPLPNPNAPSGPGDAPPPPAQPAGVKDLALYDIPGSITLPDGTRLAAGTGDGGEAQATIRRGALEVTLVVDGDDDGRCQLDRFKADLAKRHPGSTLDTAGATTATGGAVALLRRSTEAGATTWLVGGCVGRISCRAESADRADADLALAMCKSLVPKAP
jgi:hypothetical protein